MVIAAPLGEVSSTAADFSAFPYGSALAQALRSSARSLRLIFDYVCTALLGW